MAETAPPNQVLLSLGSNVAPERNLPAAVRELARFGTIVRVSSVWESRPYGPPGQPTFLNAALRLDTHLDAHALKQDAIAAVEAALGRVRSADRYAPRPIDIDIVYFNAAIFRLDQRHIPDPDARERPFVAIPLAEIAPDFIHPQTGETLAAIAARFDPQTAGMRRRDDVQLLASEQRPR